MIFANQREQKKLRGKPTLSFAGNDLTPFMKKWQRLTNINSFLKFYCGIIINHLNVDGIIIMNEI